MRGRACCACFFNENSFRWIIHVLKYQISIKLQFKKVSSFHQDKLHKGLTHDTTRINFAPLSGALNIA